LCQRQRLVLPPGLEGRDQVRHGDKVPLEGQQGKEEVLARARGRHGRSPRRGHFVGSTQMGWFSSGPSFIPWTARNRRTIDGPSLNGCAVRAGSKRAASRKSFCSNLARASS